MSILGKVLIFFNLLAAAAFAYFTLENWRARQDLTWAAFQRQVQLDGIPLEAPTTPSADLAGDRVPFVVVLNENRYESVPKAKLDAIIPSGGTIFGGAGVKDQTEEIKRVQKKVFDHIASAAPAAADPSLRFQWLRAYLLAIAVTGAERDGVAAIFDMRDESKRDAARRDLPLMGRTSSQTAALRTLYDLELLGDPQAIMPDEVRATRIAQARESVKRFVLGEAPFGAAAGGDKAENERNLKNALVAALQDRAGDVQKQKVIENAGGDPTGFAHVAAVAVEPLTDKQSTDRAAAALIAYAASKAAVPTEAAALTAVAALVRPSALGKMDDEIEKAAANLLNSKFDEAALPAAANKTANGDPQGEKARKIAHLLYHIDGWRYADKTATADRQAWHSRVSSIVGLPAYIRAAEAEATEYSEAGQRLIASITEEQSKFEAEYQAQVQRVLFLYSQWLTLDTQLKAQTAITDENIRLMSERKTERDKLLEELARAQADAKDSLDKLKKTQQALFAIQVDLRNAQEALLKLEKELRRIELGPTETTN